MRGAPKKKPDDVRKNRGIKFSDKEWLRVVIKAKKSKMTIAKYIRFTLGVDKS